MEPKEFTFQSLQELAFVDPIISSALSLYNHKGITQHDCLLAIVKALHEQNRTLIKDAMFLHQTMSPQQSALYKKMMNQE